ncbi:ABC transporter substrate-binding protein [Hymenobacter sp. YC55]|uniref:ABC transporter substrate-binding protein n=1 Tax=Hymenobacter sp. YC55 TaxID=3034019 RepID=UPI0023F921FD|nr:ABC transporter substrate-binding protein [Hymenobacter sp. YC55]MDF7813285.1 ABC transporter substrate-binding protein [Hymenobacter sp. YC55]
MTRYLQNVFIFLLLSSCGVAGCTSSLKSEAVRIRWSTDPQTLDPLVASIPQAQEVINLLHCSLLVGDRNQRISPWLAQALPIVSRRDSLTLLTYSLRPEATWDNGQPVLAHDVAFTLKLLNCPGLPTEFARTQYGFVTDIELDVKDPRRFTLVCRTAASGIIFSSGDFAILPEYAVDPQKYLRAVSLSLLQTDTVAALRQYPGVRSFARHYRQSNYGQHPERLPGCGPYTLKAWAKGRYLRLQRKAKWWATKLTPSPAWLQAHASRLDYQIIPDNAQALLAIRRGDIDLYPMPAARDFDQLRHSADTTKLAFYTTDSYEMVSVGFNTQRPFLRDALTRRALSLLFDVPGLIQATQPGLAYRSVGIIRPNDKPAYNDSLSLAPFDLRQAANLLRQAGWQRNSDGRWVRGATETLAFSISYQANAPDHEAVARQFQAAATQLGIPVKLNPAEEQLYRQQLIQGDTDLHVRTTRGNPFTYNFMTILHSRSIGLNNFTQYRSKVADRLMEAIMLEQNESRRVKLLRRFQQQIQQDSPLVVLFFIRNRLIASKRLRGVQPLRVRPGYDALNLSVALLGK